MAIPESFLLGLLVLLGSLAQSEATLRCVHEVPKSFNRATFPEDFVFGSSSAAYQYEGEANKSGRGPSIWDTFTHEFPERIADGSNGDVAIDFYHRYEEDVDLMKKMNMDAFRLSISWSRILPHGKLSAGVNMEGIKFYNNFIDYLLLRGVQPFVTLFHWDVPQALEDKYGGFLSPRIVDDFQDFADLCFKTFGDRVKHWITVNEPLQFTTGGYDSGLFAPGRCSKWVNEACQAGNSATEPYVVNHHLLLGHAAVVRLYKTKYQASQKGEIGIVLSPEWLEPYSNTQADQEAVKRGLDFSLGWQMSPLTYGHYPQSMQTYVGERLPKFTCEQSKMLKGSFDFIGINYYTARYASNNDYVDPEKVRYQTDMRVNLSTERNCDPIGLTASSNWLYIYPEGIRYLLNYTKDTYKNPKIYITENGVDELNNSTLSLPEALKDPLRTDSLLCHLWNVHRSISEYGVNVKGYMAWTFLDDFEWNGGYTSRFGFYYIDYKNGLKRIPKDSAKWFQTFLEKKERSPKDEL